MQTSRRAFLKRFGSSLTASALIPSLGLPPRMTFALSDIPAVTDPTIHFLNRITYGPLPEEVDRARQLGIEAYLDEQLHPEQIDDLDMDRRLIELPILKMDRRTVHRLDGREYRAYIALTTGMVMRAVYSKRQLFERVVEFWTDHFNVPSAELGPDVVVMQREAIRRHALGNFRDLIFGTAQSPAMLYYLDQTFSDKEHPNENYARELMELHTLGVDGGYTETDVKEMARALTGWTVHDGTRTGFYFDPTRHDTEEKTLLGHSLPSGRGIEDGLHALSLVVTHPATARFICHKLCIRFVSDQPPASLVESATAVWMQNDGAVLPVLRHILLSSEFAASVGQKLRRPLDFFIGALRSTGTEFREFWVMEALLQDLAQVPYSWNPPNGYPDQASAWMSSAGLLARWNTAMELTHRAHSESDTGMSTHLIELIGTPQTAGELVDSAARRVFGVPILGDARAHFVTYLTGDGSAESPVTPHMLANKLGTLFGLMLASPQYQWR